MLLSHERTKQLYHFPHINCRPFSIVSDDRFQKLSLGRSDDNRWKFLHHKLLSQLLIGLFVRIPEVGAVLLGKINQDRLKVIVREKAEGATLYNSIVETLTHCDRSGNLRLSGTP